MTTTATATFIATDTDGTWELELIEIDTTGWHYGKVITAPAHMTRWIGCRMDFPLNEISSVTR